MAGNGDVRAGRRFRGPFVLLFTGTALVFWLVSGRIDGAGAGAGFLTDAPTLGTFLTSHLFHVDGWHLSANLLVILTLGAWLESRHGTARFAILYALLALGSTAACWVVGALAQASGVHGGLGAISYGASGVAVGCLAAVAARAPDGWPIRGAIADSVWPRHALWAAVFLAAAGIAWLDQEGVLHWVDSTGQRAAWIFLLPQVSGVAIALAALRLEPWAERRALELRAARDERERERVRAIRARVDDLLEKISASGYGSLSADERSFLRYASKHFKREE